MALARQWVGPDLCGLELNKKFAQPPRHHPQAAELLFYDEQVSGLKSVLLAAFVDEAHLAFDDDAQFVERVGVEAQGAGLGFPDADRGLRKRSVVEDVGFLLRVSLEHEVGKGQADVLHALHDVAVLVKAMKR